MQTTPKGFTCKTPDEIAYFRLASLRGALRLAAVGMKSRGGALRPKLAAEFGLTARAPYPDFIAAIEAKMATIREAR